MGGKKPHGRQIPKGSIALVGFFSLLNLIYDQD
jgi:hypothetical protein